MRKKLILLGAGVLGAAMLLPGLALAGPYGKGHGGPTVTTVTHTTTYVRGGPPAWAPAHGYRQKHAHQHQHRHRHYRGHRQPATVYYAPVHRHPPTVYYEPSRSSVDLTVRYRTHF
jgi:hypothetical protein